MDECLKGNYSDSYYLIIVLFAVKLREEMANFCVKITMYFLCMCLYLYTFV